MAIEYFDGSVDLHSLQNQMNYYEAINDVTFSALSAIQDPGSTTLSGTHNYNKGTYAPTVAGGVNSLLLVAVTAGQTLAAAKAAELAAKPGVTFVFEAPQIYVSDALQDVVAFRMPNP